MDVEAEMGGHVYGAEVEMGGRSMMGREWSWGAGGTRVWFTSSGVRQQGLKDPIATALWKSPGNLQISSQPHRQCKRQRKPLSL